LRMVAEGYGVSLIPEKATTGRNDCRFLPIDPQAMRRIAYAMAKGHQSLPIRKKLQQFLKRWEW